MLDLKTWCEAHVIMTLVRLGCSLVNSASASPSLQQQSPCDRSVRLQARAEYQGHLLPATAGSRHTLPAVKSDLTVITSVIRRLTYFVTGDCLWLRGMDTRSHVES